MAAIPASEFNEALYLRIHDDVRLAVARGEHASGYEHYCQHGLAEGRKLARFDANKSHFLTDYSRLVRELLAEHPDDPDLAMARAIGAQSLEIFAETGDKHCAILDRVGLQSGEAIYDLACGSGRTAAALRRRDWHGEYRGADIIPELIDYARQKNPGFEFSVHHDFSINADDATQDIVFAWSLFTHLQLEEIFLYAQDAHRALKPGGILVFSYLTLTEPEHRELFQQRVASLGNGEVHRHLDMFLDVSTLAVMFEEMLGYKRVELIDGHDETATPLGSFGQAVAVFRK